MKHVKNHKKLLLLSIRQDEQTMLEERRSFAAHGHLDLTQIDLLNVFDMPQFDGSVTSGYDAVLIGGASEASVLEPEKYSFLESGQLLIRDCLNLEIPVFASCFGFQLAVLALGGEIVSDKTRFEMGTLPISLTDNSAVDPLLCDTPNGFLAVAVHQEKAMFVPEGCELLAHTDECVHGFRVSGKPFWAFQFHPEVDRATLVSRLTIFKDRYTKDDNHFNEVISSARETPESNRLVRKFVERIVC